MICYDHEAILLDPCSMSQTKTKFRFWFQNTWLKEESFHNEMTNYWKSIFPTHVMSKLIDLSRFTGIWGRNFFKKFRKKIKRQKEVISSFEDCVDKERTKRYFTEINKLDNY